MNHTFRNHCRIFLYLQSQKWFKHLHLVGAVGEPGVSEGGATVMEKNFVDHVYFWTEIITKFSSWMSNYTQQKFRLGAVVPDL